MRFEWDENKNRENRKKHGVSFEIAMEVFDDPFSLTSRDRIVEGEERLWTLGRVEDLLNIGSLLRHGNDRNKVVAPLSFLYTCS